jgi:hypothetical protein
MTAQTRAARHGRATKAERLGRGHEARLRQLRAALREQMARGAVAGSVPSGPAAPGWPGGPDDSSTTEDVMVAEATLLIEDPLPENAVYRDEGCEVARSCLACPLALCVLDRQGSPSERRREGRDRLIRLLLGRGWSAARVGQQFDLSAAQVRRIRATGPLR